MFEFIRRFREKRFQQKKAKFEADFNSACKKMNLTPEESKIFRDSFTTGLMFLMNSGEYAISLEWKGMKLEVIIYAIPFVYDSSKYPNLWCFGRFDPEAYEYENLPDYESNPYPAGDDEVLCFDTETRTIWFCSADIGEDYISIIPDRFGVVENTGISLSEFWKLLSDN